MIITLQTLIFFRESLLGAIDWLLRPYYKNFLPFNCDGSNTEDEESEDHVFAEFDDEKGVVFYPPVYAQRYAAVSDCLMDERWCGKLDKVVDLGYHDMSFIKYLKEVPGVKCILGVDIESIPLRCSSDLFAGEEYSPKRENPLQVTLYQGNAADPDYRLIGCDAVVAIEMIEHMLPHDLDRLVHTVFGFIKPWIFVFTTPNSDFNALFKALEKNGLRRLDHFFEWTREQFHDWCSNIVTRYPQYAVTCKGIGPGPPGTLHYGCCSQLALFVSKDYHKQQDLNLNSLALVANTQNYNDVSEMIGSLECPESPECNTENNMLCLPAKLNCTTLQVKKFSKTTQNMMAKNKIDSLVHTREVVDKIRHLTKMLNFNKESLNKEQENGTWCNINWGHNAPYWNQYYNVVREYSYPFENKSEECRILDLISDEVNRLIDSQYDQLSVDESKLEIPIDHLMDVVRHITDDVDRVKDLLEWNGYEVVGEVVIHSRLVVVSGSMATCDEDWQENDILSDWDTTDVHSTSLSDGSTTAPDINGRCLRRALDYKVRKLRSILSADEDIATELDRVVCRLMKLALLTSRGRQSPPPARWMQYKLFDLLTLTEKAIERRKKHFIDNYPLKTVDYDLIEGLGDVEEDGNCLLAFGVKAARDVLDYAEDLLRARMFGPKAELVGYDEVIREGMSLQASEYHFLEKFAYGLEEADGAMARREMNKLCIFGERHRTNNPVEEFEFVDDTIHSPSLVDIEPLLDGSICNTNFDRFVHLNREETTLQRTQAWVDDDVEIVPYPNHDTVAIISSGDTDHSLSNLVRYRLKKSYKRQKIFNIKQINELDTKLHKKSHRASHGKDRKMKKEDNKNRDKTGKMKKEKKKCSYNVLVKSCSNQISSINIDGFKSKRKINSNPISESLIKLCHPNNTEKYIDNVQHLTVDNRISPNFINSDVGESSNVSAPEESFLINIIMDNMEETIALRRTIGTDADIESDILDKENILGGLVNIIKDDNFYYKSEIENVHSQTIFLCDINEPSTSKGVRHVSMDVQCGPDVTPAYHMSSAATSFTKLPKIFTTGIKIGDSLTSIRTQNNSDFGTSTNNYNDNYKTMAPRTKSAGIRIKDSDSFICEKVECATMTHDTRTNDVVCTETKLIKAMSSGSKIEDSGSDVCHSVGSFLKSSIIDVNSSNNTSEIKIKSSVTKEIAADHKCLSTKYGRSQLCCGSVQCHSYKDKQLSEDIVYQGEWQRYRPKTIIRKRIIYNTVTAKKGSEGVKTVKRIKVKSKEKIQINRTEKTTDRKIVNGSYARNSEPNKIKKEPRNKKLQAFNNVIKCNRNIIKVASKLTINCASKSIKSVIQKGLTVNNESEHRKYTKKSHIPLYLKRNLKFQSKVMTESDTLNQSIDSVNTVLKMNKEKPVGQVAPLVRSKTEDIKKDLLKFLDIPREPISYIVFRNETDNKNTECDFPSNTKENDMQKDGGNKRSYSPQSQNSSTCSSPNSIATVRAASTRAKTTKKHSEFKNLNQDFESDKNLIRNKKYSKKFRNGKKTDDKVQDNKENIPESSTKYNTMHKEFSNKGTFVERNKSVYRAQLTTDNLPLQNTINSISKHKVQIQKNTNVTIPRPDENEYKTASPSVSISRPLVLSKSINNKDGGVIVNSISNLLSSPEDTLHTNLPNLTINFSEADYRIPDGDQLEKKYYSSNSILSDMRKLIEESINFENTFDNYESIDSKTVILDREDAHKTNLGESFSPTSFKTVITNEDLNNSLIQSDFEDVMNQTLDSTLEEASIMSVPDTALTLTDVDLLSFKSITPGSKMSKYFLADSDFINTGLSISNECSNPAGALALQAFSGFSVNAEPVAGDRPNHVNFIDSETGSIALQIARQATSEEVFISGRSSDSFESCFVDEDALVPSWLFHISQQSLDEEETEQLQPQLPLAIPEPMLDLNGNMLGGVAAGTGAGDGYGMHSDHSQDSSGQGTSLSSTDQSTSSGGQSEHKTILLLGNDGSSSWRIFYLLAIKYCIVLGYQGDHKPPLYMMANRYWSQHWRRWPTQRAGIRAVNHVILIDPSAFAAQFELLQDSMDNALAVPTIAIPSEDMADTSFVIIEGGEYLAMEFESYDGRRNPVMPLMTTSDADADISSLDTDVPDSSDN
ncbi:hen1 methyltransferase [Aphomia sociella]